ncbi:MAG: GspH/FimT family protein [Thiothrix sp.]|nr:GspH/FimT family protein [Thiothrix sp.]
MIRQKGFSLLEVMLVLVLAALLMGVVATSLSEGPVLRRSAREVAASLRHARSIAILRQMPMTWSMDTGKKTFWIGSSQGERRELHAGITPRLNTAASEVSGATGSVRFFPDGSSTGGSVELEANGQAFKINIEWITGRVSIL